jgi:predicted phosphodiesterase
MPDGAARQPADPAAIPLLVTDRPVLVFGGCYSNLQATQALLAAGARLAVPPERMLCTGDVIAYGADPHATLTLLREAGIATLRGNCEESLAQEAGDCGCGFAPGSVCDRLAAAWFTHAQRHVDAADRRWMAALPPRIDLLMAGRRIALVHGAPSRINRFVFASTPEGEIAAEIARSGAEGVIAGHCGLPFTRRLGRTLWHNTGAIGLPANDGTPRGWFSLLTPRGEGIDIRTLPLDYDHHGAARAMRRAGLPAEYAETMASGIWPSFDVLPPAEQARSGHALAPTATLWTGAPAAEPTPVAVTHPTARVALERLETLWFNTGTLCNIACAGCYIESSPRNDRLRYLARADFDAFLEQAADHPALTEIGFTGGEPFMNPDAPGMIEAALARGYRTLVLSNAMRPMQRHLPLLARLAAAHAGRLSVRVSLDHCTPAGHERVRGQGSFAPAMAGLAGLARAGIGLAVAARFDAGESEGACRAGFAALFQAQGLALDAWNPAHLVLFPELTGGPPPPEVSETCWQALRSRGRAVMCQTSRMVVHRNGEAAPRVVACTLLPYAAAFDLGASLAEAARPVQLDHPHCARFCVFGAASCAPSGAPG